MLTYRRAALAACASVFVCSPALAQDRAPRFEASVDVGAAFVAYTDADHDGPRTPLRVFSAALRFRPTPRYAVGIETIQVLVPWHTTLTEGGHFDRTVLESMLGVVNRAYFFTDDRFAGYAEGFFGVAIPSNANIEGNSYSTGFDSTVALGVDAALTRGLRLGTSTAMNFSFIPEASIDVAYYTGPRDAARVPSLVVAQRVGLTFAAF